MSSLLTRLAKERDKEGTPGMTNAGGEIEMGGMIGDGKRSFMGGN